MYVSLLIISHYNVITFTQYVICWLTKFILRDKVYISNYVLIELIRMLNDKHSFVIHIHLMFNRITRIGLLVLRFIEMFFQCGSLEVEHNELSLSILTIGKHISPSNSSYKDITLYINLKYYPFVVYFGVVSVGIRFLCRYVNFLL